MEAWKGVCYGVGVASQLMEYSLLSEILNKFIYVFYFMLKISASVLMRKVAVSFCYLASLIVKFFLYYGWFRRINVAELKETSTLLCLFR